MIFKKPKGAAVLPAVLIVFSAFDLIANSLALMNSELSDSTTVIFNSLLLRSALLLLAAAALLLAVLKVKPKITLIAALHCMPYPLFGVL